LASLISMLPSPQCDSLLERVLHRVPPRIRRLARYASVSVISTTVGLSTLAILIDVGHWPPTWANVAATGLGTIPSFELNRRWVWGRDGHRSLLREVIPFGGLCLVELVASTAAVHTAAAWTLHAGWGPGLRTVVDLAANVTTYGLLWVVQYLVLDRVLFARRPPRASVTGDPPGLSPHEATPRGQPEGQTIQAGSRPSSSAVQELTSGWVR
jgi:putative flippase GtrA